jgi:tetratricopeptide (TPR) repeat protein
MINEAYEVLSDPDRRNNYDAVLGFSQQPKPASPKPKTPPPNPPTQEKPKPTQTASRPQPRPKQTTSSDEIKQIMLQAERAFTQNRFREAMDKAYIVTQRQPRNASAYALLGDIYRMDGNFERAISMYTYASQFDPRNPIYQRRLEELTRRPPPSEVKKPAQYSHKAILGKDWKLHLGMTGGWMAIIIMLFYAYAYPGRPAEAFASLLPMIATWSLNLLVLLFAGGASAGGLLMMSGVIDKFELAVMMRGTRRTGVPAGAYLVVIAIISFWSAAIVYLVLGIVHDSFNRSLTRVFLAVSGLTLAFTIAYSLGWLSVLLFGGNIIFIGFLSGWIVADALYETIRSSAKS